MNDKIKFNRNFFQDMLVTMSTFVENANFEFTCKIFFDMSKLQIFYQYFINVSLFEVISNWIFDFKFPNRSKTSFWLHFWINWMRKKVYKWIWQFVIAIKLTIQISIIMLIDLIDQINKIEIKTILINNFTSIFSIQIKRICDRFRVTIHINIEIQFINFNQVINLVNFQKVISKNFSIHFQLFCRLQNSFFC